MNTKESYACDCCGGRVAASSRLRLIARCLPLFFTT
ncbi:unnamed protein product, partial [Rotaria sp. Silwood1]